MPFVVKSFGDLSVTELFKIYFLRAQVFVVEQNCVYQDVDKKDLKAWHVLHLEHEQLVAYARIVPGDGEMGPSIGRVVVDLAARKNGKGRNLMQISIQKAEELFPGKDIVISAQTYLHKFYTDLGFKSEGNTYLEDGIPHIKMRLTKSHP
jgi:ElaA protein